MIERSANRLDEARVRSSAHKHQPIPTRRARHSRSVSQFSYNRGVPVARSEIRNVAVIAHVDHGKTSLVNSMLGQAGLVHLKFGESGFTLDSMTGNPLEREKGVTILAKIIGIPYRDQRAENSGIIRLNIIDTP